MDEIDSLRFALTTTFHKAGRNWRRLVNDLVSAHGLSEAGAQPLLAIGRIGEGVRQIVVADEIGIESASLVRLLDQLSAGGFIERRDDPADRRAKTLWLTPKGRRVTDLFERELVVLRAKVLRDVGRQDIEGALRIFRALEIAVSDDRETL